MASLIPYLVVAFIIFIGILGLLFLYARFIYLGYDCAHSTGAWCHNDWQCKQPCPSINDCYSSGTDLMSCLTQRTAPAQSCTATNCQCALDPSQGINCMAGCSMNLSNVPAEVICRTAANPTGAARTQPS